MNVEETALVDDSIVEVAMAKIEHALLRYEYIKYKIESAILEEYLGSAEETELERL